MPLWQTHLDVEHAALDAYHEFVNPQLCAAFAFSPRLMLDVGCAAGGFGQLVKQQYPGARVVGVEINRAAAAAARQKLDVVFDQRIEDIDFAAAGFAEGAFDTVILADVLEHLYNPWQLLVDLRRRLAVDAQVIASIPNTRHLGLVLELLDHGIWRYAERGLLDITHLRFFTLASIGDLFEQTGYRLERVISNPDPNLLPLYEQAKSQSRSTLKLGRVTLENLSAQELADLVTWQYFVRARPG